MVHWRIKRARDLKGRYKGDNASTVFNEAWVAEDLLKDGSIENGKSLLTGSLRVSMTNKCKSCFCDCHCNVKEHSDADGICVCLQCTCQPGTLINSDECESCQ